MHLLKEYLPHTLAAIKSTGVAFEIIIVDDCSNDGSVEFIKTEYPELTYLLTPKIKAFLIPVTAVSKFHNIN